MKQYTERIDFTLPIEAKKRLKIAAERDGISMSELARRRVRAVADTETSSA